MVCAADTHVFLARLGRVDDRVVHWIEVDAIFLVVHTRWSLTDTQVNIDEKMKRQLAEAAENPTLEMFDAALAIVDKDICRSLQGFWVTEIFLAYYENKTVVDDLVANEDQLGLPVTGLRARSSTVGSDTTRDEMLRVRNGVSLLLFCCCCCCCCSWRSRKRWRSSCCAFVLRARSFDGGLTCSSFFVLSAVCCCAACAPGVQHDGPHCVAARV